MKSLIYVCSPYGGREENYRAALVYGRYVISRGCLPVIPHTMLHGIVDDADPKGRAAGLEIGQSLLKICSEIWVFGKEGGETAGMSGEITAAEQLGKPIKYISGAIAPDNRSTELAQIARRYEELTGGFNRMMVEDAAGFLDNGITCELILLAIETAARRVSGSVWSYARRILQRCEAQRVFTAEQFRERCAAGKQPPQRRNAAYDIDSFEKMLDREE